MLTGEEDRNIPVPRLLAVLVSYGGLRLLPVPTKQQRCIGRHCRRAPRDQLNVLVIVFLIYDFTVFPGRDYGLMLLHMLAVIGLKFHGGLIESLVPACAL